MHARFYPVCKLSPAVLYNKTNQLKPLYMILVSHWYKVYIYTLVFVGKKRPQTNNVKNNILFFRFIFWGNISYPKPFLTDFYSFQLACLFLRCLSGLGKRPQVYYYLRTAHVTQQGKFKKAKPSAMCTLRKNLRSRINLRALCTRIGHVKGQFEFEYEYNTYTTTVQIYAIDVTRFERTT